MDASSVESEIALDVYTAVIVETLTSDRGRASVLFKDQASYLNDKDVFLNVKNFDDLVAYFEAHKVPFTSRVEMGSNQLMVLSFHHDFEIDGILTPFRVSAKIYEGFSPEFLIHCEDPKLTKSLFDTVMDPVRDTERASKTSWEGVARVGSCVFKDMEVGYVIDTSNTAGSGVFLIPHEQVF